MALRWTRRARRREVSKTASFSTSCFLLHLSAKPVIVIPLDGADGVLPVSVQEAAAGAPVSQDSGLRGQLRLLTHNWSLSCRPAAAPPSPFPPCCPALCSSHLLICQNDLSAVAPPLLLLLLLLPSTPFSLSLCLICAALPGANPRPDRQLLIGFRCLWRRLGGEGVGGVWGAGFHAAFSIN